MYAVSEQVKNAIKNPNRVSTIQGTLTTVIGEVYALNDANIIKDSLYITNQIVNNSKMSFGSVYAGECGLVINSDIDRYSLFGAEIKLNLVIEGESIPLGVFFVDTSERIGSKIKLTAIDSMSKFDMALEEDSNGSWYALLDFITHKCGVELAQTQEDIINMHTNASIQSYSLQQSKVQTYRDAIAYLCMIICANATIDRQGKLKIVQYATTPCDTNDRNTRLNNCKFNDYVTKYAGIKARFFKEENYYPYEVTEEVDGLVLDLGDIPIVGGTTETKYNTLQAMLETLKEIVYIPSTLYIAPNPTYELGDLITCNNINNTSESANVYVMSYKYDYRKKETINCYGENPLLQNVKSKEDKYNTAIENQMAMSSMNIINFINADRYLIRREPITIATLKFSVQGDCRPLLICTVSFTMDVDGYVEFSLHNGLVAIENAVYKCYYLKGEHFATFTYLDEMTANSRMELHVKAKCYADVTSDVRVHEARIKTLENGWELIQDGAEDLTVEEVPVDRTEPNCVIAPQGVKAIVYTQGINAGLSTWDGTLEFSDIFRAIELSRMSVSGFSETLGLTQE